MPSVIVPRCPRAGLAILVILALARDEPRSREAQVNGRDADQRSPPRMRRVVFANLYSTAPKSHGRATRGGKRELRFLRRWAQKSDDRIGFFGSMLLRPR